MISNAISWQVLPYGNIKKFKSKKNIRFSKKNQIRIIPNKEEMKKEMIKGEKEEIEMMKRKRELESGKDQYSVDVKFGQYMADKYINPVINKDKK
jgi:hypothetical protein